MNNTGPNPPSVKRRLRLNIPPEFVADWLDLPPGHRLVAVDSRNDPLGIIAILEGPDFPETPTDVESPYGHISRTITRNAETGEVLSDEQEIRWYGKDDPQVTPGLVPIPDPTCPECTQGKHDNCTGQAMDGDDHLTSCQCPDCYGSPS